VLAEFPGCREPELTERATMLYTARMIEDSALGAAGRKRRWRALLPNLGTISRLTLRWLGTVATLALGGALAMLVVGLLVHQGHRSARGSDTGVHNGYTTSVNSARQRQALSNVSARQNWFHR